MFKKLWPCQCGRHLMEGTAGCWTEALGTRLPGFCFSEASVLKVNRLHLQGQLKLDITFQNTLRSL